MTSQDLSMNDIQKTKDEIQAIYDEALKELQNVESEKDDITHSYIKKLEEEKIEQLENELQTTDHA